MDLAKQLETRILALPGVEARKSRWMSRKGYYVGPREFAHFHGGKEIDVRLTRKGQKKHSDRIRNDWRVRFRGRPSEWITLSFSKADDVNYAIEILRLALEQNITTTDEVDPKARHDSRIPRVPPP